MSLSSQVSSTRSGYRDFASVLLALAGLRIALPFIKVPISIAPAIDFLLLITVFIATIFAIYRAMSEKPKPQFAFLILLIGVFIQVASLSITNDVFNGRGLGGIAFFTLSQTGLAIWCIGLGAVISSLLREKNILIPVAIFLIGFDIFLVLTPLGFTQRIMKANPNLLNQVAMVIPKVTTHAQTASNATVAKAGLVGPADLVFLGAFFLAMYRFDMKPKETLKVMIPVLIAYMILVLVTGWALPALVPIGLVTLLVNRHEFNLNKDEKVSTIVLALIAVGILVFSATRKPAPPAEPSPSATSSELPTSTNSPAQGDLNQPLSSAPSDGQNKPSPR